VPEEQAAAFRPKPPPLWRVSDALPRLRQLPGVLPDGSPLQAFLPQLGTEQPDSALRARAALASTLIAGLELARDGVLALDQDAAWTPVRVIPPPYPVTGFAHDRLVMEAMRSGACISLFQAMLHASRISS
jgi:hypothetical protein